MYGFSKLNQKGFSLIEVIIALGVMMGTVTILAMSWSGSQLRLRKMKINYQAAYLLDFKVADILREYKDQVSLLPEEDKGDFSKLSPEYKGFSWEITSKEFEMPDLTPLLIHQGNNQGGQGADSILILMMDQLSEFFSQSAKEVTVTIVYTVGKNKVKYSASTFVIDFNRQLLLPTGGGAAPVPGGP